MAILEAYGDKIVGGTSDPTEITWTAWNALSTAEQKALGQVMITDVPGAIGTIQADIIKLLWTNPNPTAELAPGAVTASENARNFDWLLVEWKRSTAAGLVSYTIVSAKGSGGRIHDTRVVNDEATITQRYRDVGTLSDGRISFGGGKIITPGSPGTTTTDHTVVIVTAVYGIKTTIDLNFSAIAQDVSTSANKCMLSDGVTSVEDMLEVVDISSQYQGSGVQSCFKYGKLIQASIEVTPAAITHGTVLIPQLPKVRKVHYMSVGMNNGQNVTCILDNVAGQDYAQLSVYYPDAVAAARIDATFLYLTV